MRMGWKEGGGSEFHPFICFRRPGFFASGGGFFPQRLVRALHLLDFYSVCLSCYFVLCRFRGLDGGEDVVLDAADMLVVVWLDSGMERVRNCSSNANSAVLSSFRVSRIRLSCSAECSNSSLELVDLGLPGVSSIVWSSPLTACKFTIANRIT
jgi:hypothetical protein